MREKGMKIEGVPFTRTIWESLERIEHMGQAGSSWWRTIELGNLRVRMVEYSPGYASDHWCCRGHVVLVLRGEIETLLRDGRRFVTRQGESWQVSDRDGEHRSSSPGGATMFIID